MSHSKDNRWRHWLLPIGIILFCGGVIWVTTTFEKMPPILKRGIQPSDFPQLVSGLIIVLTALMVWREPIEPTETPSRTTWGSLALMGVFGMVTAFDFFLALSVFAIGLAVLWGERRLAWLGLVGVGIPLAVFLLFDLVFEVRFPRGLLTRLWYG